MEYFPYDPIQKGYSNYSFRYSYGASRQAILRVFEEHKEDVVLLLPHEDTGGYGMTFPELRYNLLRAAFVAIPMGDDFLVTKNRQDGKLGMTSRADFERVVHLWRDN